MNKLLIYLCFLAFGLITLNCDINTSAQTKKTLTNITKPSIIVKKSERKLYLYDNKKLVKTYNMALGFSPDGDKETEGDGKTPEGKFYVFTKNEKSAFYLSLGLSYPNKEDAARGYKAGLITKDEFDAINKAIQEKKMPLQKTKLGGEIYIHGGGTESDWTAGCSALENEDIKELFALIPIGTEVIIEP